jgi:lipoprotein NlpD
MNHPARHCLHTAAPAATSDRCQSGAATRRVPGLAVLAMMLALGLSACTSRSLTNAPVEDRGTSRPSSAPAAAPARPAAALPGAENAGKPGFYTVKPGDTLIRIGLDTGQNWRDISRWNTIDNPNQIEVGQVLRVTPPAGNDAVVTRPITSSAAGAAPTPLPAQGQAAPAAKPAPASAPQPQAAASAPQAPAGGEEEIAWLWPAQGTPVAGFDEVKNKGIDIAGKAGDPVLAAADGRVVYSGAGLRGYGNLIILKHNNTYLTAYAHNQTLLVKEDQSVRKGQKIAEMGNSDADRVKLHFEIRRQGKPVDPVKYLPAR